MHTIESIIESELKEIGKEPKALANFAAIKEDDLCTLHHGYGMHIRNKYGLWTKSELTKAWRTDESSHVMDGSIDCSPDHPDQMSMTIIETMWKQLQPPSPETVQ